MREHQIVITLKPEQFIEVQRLTRAAGAKSMGIFVRQKLLAALGIEGATASALGKKPGSASMVRLSGELKRVHGELKSFVAESLSRAYVEEPLEVVVQTPVEEEQPVFDDFPAVLAELPDVDSGLPEAATGGLEFAYFPGASMTLDESGPPTSFEEALREFEQAQDDLEQLARKAFAISPRLGSLESPGSLDEIALHAARKKVTDPLEELLDEESSAQNIENLESEDGDDELTDNDEVDEVFDVPLPIPMRPPQPVDTALPEMPASPPLPPSPPPPPPLPRTLGSPDSPFSGGPPPRKRQ
jgi:hypothetical protein